MISFKTFVTEESVAATKRQNMTHLSQMKPYVFIEWLDSIKKDARGVIDSKVPATLKVDGLSFRFGKDGNGRVFVEGARTGPQSESGAFSSYAASKGSIEPIMIRARHYDDILEFFKKDRTFMNSIPNDTKVYCELFYNRMAEAQDATGIQFVTIKYDKRKVGSFMTILPYNILTASTGQTHPNKDAILKDLLKASNSKIRIIDPNLGYSDSIDINAFINPLESLLKNKNETIRVLKSRKGADKELKQNYLEVIQKVKENLANHLLWNPNICGMDKLCDVEQGEGLVFHLGGDYGSVKITSPEFQMAHHGSVK